MTAVLIERGPDTGESGWTLPGDPADLVQLSGQLGRLAQALEDCTVQVEAARGQLSSWVGQGARAFERLDLAQRPKWRIAAESFGAASTALVDYARDLAAAQSRATQARVLYDQGLAESAAWAASLAAARAASPHAVVVAGPDPGAEEQARALALLQAARAESDAAARRLAALLHSAEEAAPTGPGIWDRLMGAVGSDFKVAEDFGHGIVLGVTGLAQSALELGRSAWALSPGRLVADPAGWHRALESDVGGLVALAGAVARDPLGVGKQVGEDLINAKTWSTDPAEAAGELVPQILAMIGGEGEEAIAVKATEDAVSATRDIELRQLADRIVENHAWRRRKIENREFPEFSTPQQLSDHVYNVIRGYTHKKDLSAGRTAYYDDSSKTIVIHDPNSAHGGTVFHTRGVKRLRGLN